MIFFCVLQFEDIPVGTVALDRPLETNNCVSEVCVRGTVPLTHDRAGHISLCPALISSLPATCRPQTASGYGFTYKSLDAPIGI